MKVIKVNESENYSELIMCTGCKTRKHKSKFNPNFGKMYCDECRKEKDVKKTIRKKRYYVPEDNYTWINGDSEIFCG